MPKFRNIPKIEKIPYGKLPKDKKLKAIKQKYAIETDYQNRLGKKLRNL